MSWMGMSNAGLPGKARKPRNTDPGEENAERELEQQKKRESGTRTIYPVEKPSVNPTPKPQAPGTTPRTPLINED